MRFTVLNPISALRAKEDILYPFCSAISFTLSLTIEIRYTPRCHDKADCTNNSPLTVLFTEG